MNLNLQCERRSLLSSRVLVHKCLKGFFVNHAGDAADRRAVGDCDQGGDGLDSVLLGEGRLLIHVDLSKKHVRVPIGNSSEDRIHLPARPAPGCPEIQYHCVCCLLDDAVIRGRRDGETRVM